MVAEGDLNAPSGVVADVLDGNVRESGPPADGVWNAADVIETTL